MTIWFLRRSGSPPNSFLNSGLLFFLFSVLLSSCAESTETKVQRFLLKGNELALKRNYDEAAHNYREALKLDSCFADAWNNLGTLQFEQHKYEKALESYNQAILCNPQFMDTYFNRSNVLYELNNLELALKDLQKIQQKFPDTSIVYFSRGLIYTKLQQYDSAKRAFRKAKSLNPKDVEATINLGIVLYYEGKLDSAEAILRNVADNSGQEGNIYNSLALIEADRQNYAGALAYAGKALGFKKMDPYFLNNRGYIYLMQGEMDKALEDINMSITLDPYNAWAYRNKGIYYLKLEDFQSAQRLLKQAESMDEYLPGIFLYLGDALHGLGQRMEACDYYKKAKERGQVTDETLRTKCGAV